MMKFLLILLLTLPYNILLNAARDCPGPNWVWCAEEENSVDDDSEECVIDAGHTNGYISYGVDDRFILQPFSSDGKNHMRRKCSNQFGNANPGRDKYCCFTSNPNTTIKFDKLSYPDSTKFAWPSTPSKDFKNTVITRMGKDKQWTYRPVTGTLVPCSDNFFGANLYGIPLTCGSTVDTANHLSSQDNVLFNKIGSWETCAQEGRDCVGLTNGVPQWIRFGTDSKGGQWYYHLVITYDEKFFCAAEVFSQDKTDFDSWPLFCQRAASLYLFSDLTGKWVEVARCIGCDKTWYVYQYGVSHTHSTQITRSWGMELQRTASIDYTGIGSSSLSLTVRQEMSQTVVNSNTWHALTEAKYICDKSHLYQWITTGNELTIEGLKSFQVKSQSFRCTESSLLPKCAPNHCKDDTCQTCE